MSEEKKPDQVVYNEQQQRYDAALKAYGTNLGAPAITTHDTTHWKNRNIEKVNKELSTRYQELKKQFDSLRSEYEYNNLIYNARFQFEPNVGGTYYLYRDKNEQSFLSPIAPDECNFDYVGTFQLTADKLWKKLPDPQ